MQTLPLFYYPSTIVWVDDDKLFLNTISTVIRTGHIHRTFSYPKECLAFFKGYQSPLSSMPFLRGCREHEQFETIQHTPVDFNVPQLGEICTKPERHDEVAVMVVDYGMPEMNGIELCRSVGAGVKKILLTGEANHQDAVAAFNDNTIDRYIRKDSPTLVEDIQAYVKFLSEQYFREKTQGLLSHLEASQLSPLSDEAFVAFFNVWRKENRIVEFAVIDKSGSLLCVDCGGDKFVLAVQTDVTLDAFVSLNADTVGAEDVVSQVKNREKMAFFGIGKECWEVEVESWSDYLVDMSVLDGREKYYWAVIKV